ncbi:MAG: DUF1501 domain-containing protein [Zavarzinella sp.]
MKAIARRTFLRMGATLPCLAGSQASVRAEDLRPTAKSVILIWLDGGPSHLETFDIKPDAPAEVRGPAKAIETTVPGIRISEWLPRTAQVMKHLTLVRSLTSPLGEHGIANQYLMTGYQPSPALTYPSFGSITAWAQKTPQVLPPYVAIPEYRPYAGAGFLGKQYQPFATGGDPAKADFEVADLDFYPGLNDVRVKRRQSFLERLDNSHKSDVSPHDFARAFELSSNREVKKAFDLHQENQKTRTEYGSRTIGQSCLLARRLVEHQVPFVLIHHPGWDTHNNLLLRLKEGYTGAKVGVGLVPLLDQAYATLITDLHQRGLLASTLVVMMGEFGRTPKLNTAGGRDHWPRVFSAVLAGGGLPAGCVIGASDAMGESPKERPVTPADLLSTLFTRLGIAPHTELQTPDGRPIMVNQHGKPIKELL